MAPTLQATSRQRGGYVLKPRSMRPCSSQTRGVSAGKAANQTHLCLRHGFIGLSHDNFGAIEREIETMLELNDGKITVDLDKKTTTTVLPFKNMVSYSHPKASPDPSQIK